MLPGRYQVTLTSKKAYIDKYSFFSIINTMLSKVRAFFDYKKVHNFHRNHAHHHTVKAKTRKDYIQMVIDWECARYTKPDKPLNARQTLYKFYPEIEDKILPLLEEFHL